MYLVNQLILRTVVVIGLGLGILFLPTRVGASPPQAVATGSGSMWDDTRVRKWARDSLAGKTKKVFDSAVADLRTANPHPLAASYAYDSALVLGKDVTTLSIPTLSRHAEIESLYRDNRDLEVIARFGGAKLATLDDAVSIMFVVWSAGTRDEELAALERLAHFDRKFFLLPWSYHDLWKGASDPNDKVRVAQHARKSMRGAALDAFEALIAHDVFDIDRLEIVDAYLGSVPRDPWAHRYRGLRLRSMGRHPEALNAFAAASRMAGILSHQTKREAQALVRLGRYDEARALHVERNVRMVAEGARSDQVDYAMALSNAGELGLAREICDEVLQQEPGEAMTAYRYARIELTTGRDEKALDWARKAVQASPYEQHYHEAYLKALRSTGNASAGVAAFNAARRELPELSSLLYWEGIQALIDANRPTDAAQLAREAIRVRPGISSLRAQLYQALWAAGGKTDALVLAAETIVRHGPAAIGLETYLARVEELHDRKTANARLLKLRKQYPKQRVVWSVSVERAAEGADSDPTMLEQRLAVARKARKLNPDRTWAWELELDLRGEQEQWAEAWELVERARTRAAGWTTGELSAMLISEIKLFEREIRTHQVERVRIEDMIQRGARLRQVKVDLYHRHMTTLYSALGEEEKALEHALAWHRADPDDERAIHTLRSDFGTSVKTMRALHRYVQRDPYSGPRLEQASETHAKWGGSEIVALYYLALTRTRAPDSFNSATYASALGKLGDNARHYEVSYQRTRSLGTSERYIRWWESTRAKAQADSTRISLSFDPTTSARCKLGDTTPDQLPEEVPYALICGPSGDVELRADDLVTGNPLLLQRGRNFVQVRYNDEGELSQLWTSGGKHWSIERDKGRLVSIDQVDGHRKQSHKITTTYDAAGEIESVDGDPSALDGLLRAARALNRGEMPSLEVLDPKRSDLDDALSLAAWSGQNTVDARLALARYLVAHQTNGAEYFAEAKEQLVEVVALAKTGGGKDRQGVRAVAVYYDLLSEGRPSGLSSEEYLIWGEMEAWLRGPALGVRGSRMLLARIKEHPLALREPDRWLPQSDVDNPGMWRRHLYGAMVPNRFVERRFNAALVRANGDLVVGGEAGLSVLRKGFWEWFPFDRVEVTFDPNMQPDGVGVASEVLALTETADGALWVGTANGLLRVADDYGGLVVRWRGPSDGLPADRVHDLESLGDEVLVATKAGLRVFGAEGRVPGYDALEAVAIIELTQRAVASTNGIYWLDPATHTATRASTFVAEHVAWSEELAEFIAVAEGKTWLVSPLLDKGDVRPANDERATLMPGSNDLLSSHQIYGVTPMQVGSDMLALGIHTDRGIGFHHQHHIEHFQIPGGDSQLAVQTLATRGEVAIALTNEGVFVYERGKIHHFLHRRVHDVVSVPEAKLTFVATGSSLEAVLHAAPEAGPHLVDPIDARRIVPDGAGGIVTHDGPIVLRYDAKTGSSRELFRAEAYGEGGRLDTYPEIHDILVDSEGTVWVAAAGSLFRYREGEALEHFSMFLDADVFPSRSHYVSRVIETIDGQIWVIASQESHLSYNGQWLVGGVLKWNGDHFVRSDLENESEYWFIHRYTKLDNKIAFASTTDGFAIHTKSGAFEPMLDRSPSYARLRERVPSLFLGTPGARLGSDTWLFGTAGGLVAYWNGVWMYPERFNWMLPGQALAAYGTRAVHGLATDERGRIYVGTDLGLTIYDTKGADPASFLIDNGFIYDAFEEAAHAQLARETDVFRAGLTQGSKLAQQLEGIETSRQELELAEARFEQLSVETTGKLPPLDSSATDVAEAESVGRDQSNLEDAREHIRRKRADYRRHLLRLEQEHPRVHQMVARKPLELESARRSMPEGMAMVSYLPTPSRLYIQVVTRDRAILREVEVTEPELSLRARSVAGLLSSKDRAEEKFKAHYRDLDQTEQPGSLRGIMRAAAVAHGGLPVEDHLAWLYEQLLRPVERELADADYIYVVPYGSLTHVPFDALIRGRGEGNIDYAVDYFNIGYLTEAHMWEVVKHAVPSVRDQTVVYADPDGTLRHARAEGQAIANRRSGNVLRIGGEATFDALLDDVPNAAQLHLATHAVLDPRRPDRSYLMLADRRLSVSDASTLDLQETDLVVLSACESGLGVDGLEYATLARAFMIGGADTVVATLWQVPDVEGTRFLVEEFYRNVDQGMNRIVGPPPISWTPPERKRY